MSGCIYRDSFVSAVGTSWTGHGPRPQRHLIDYCIFIRDRPTPDPPPTYVGQPGRGSRGGCETDGVGDLGKGREGGTTDG